MSGGNLAAGLLFLILAAWVFTRTWFGGLPNQIAGEA